MRLVEPEVFLLAEPKLNREEIASWLTTLGADQFVLRDMISDAEQLIELAGRACYMSFQVGLNPNVKKIRTEIEKYFENLLASGHGSVLEHASFSFALTNVSRVFTAEMNRHRAGMAISEQSLRYVRFTDIPMWMPLSLRHDSNDSDELRELKRDTRQVFIDVFEFVEKKYQELIEMWKLDDAKELRALFGDRADQSLFALKKAYTSTFRRIVPLGVATSGVWTGNIRALRHIFTMRCSEAAEEEIRYVASKMLGIMMEHVPILFGDFYQDEKGIWHPKYPKV